MLRNINEDLIRPEKLMKANDMARLGCSSCEGCGECCRDRGSRITLDAWDVAGLKDGLGKTFDELLDTGLIEITMTDSILLPVLGKKKDQDECIFLGTDGRCSVHEFRPGICRMFPLARIYHDDGSFSYFLQEGECPNANGVKIKISKWLGVGNISSYENAVRFYHDRLKELKEQCFFAASQTEIVSLQKKFIDDNFRKSVK